MWPIPGPNVGAMKKEQAAFAERLNAALATAAIDASPAELVKLLARHGGAPVTPQAVSGWLNGRHLPKQDNMRALARIVGLQPHELQYGGKAAQGVREPRAAWPDHLGGPDRLAFESFLTLPVAHRRLLRDLIAAFAEASSRKERL